MKFVVDKNIPFLEGVLEPFGSVVYLEGDKIDAESVSDASALVVRTRTRCDKTLLEGSSVEMVATATIGYDHVDTGYLRSRGIDFATAAGCNAAGVLQYVMTALAWVDANRKALVPSEMTLGVVGVGNVGSLVADFAAKCGFRVLRCDPPRSRAEGGDFVALDELLSKADIVTCHVPLVPDGEDKTLAMASGEFFAKMKSGAVFINSSRGEVVDDKALCAALESGHVHSAVIDTWNNEPRIDSDLLSRACISTPHIAGYSLQGKANGTAMAVRALARRFALPLEDWYPEGVAPRASVPEFSWSWLQENAAAGFDIEADSKRLKANPEAFEALRNNYNYRSESF